MKSHTYKHFATGSGKLAFIETYCKMSWGGWGEDSNLKQVHCISGSQITIDICCPGANHIFLDKSDSCSFSIFLLLSLIAMNCFGTLKKNVCALLDGCASPPAISPGSRGSSNACSCLQNSHLAQVLLKWECLGRCRALCVQPPFPSSWRGEQALLTIMARSIMEATSWAHLVHAPAEIRANFKVI